MPRLIAALVRHGDYHQLAGTPSAHQPFPLTPRGESQARNAATAIGETIRSEGWDLCPVIDSSRMLRAWQTARIISDLLAETDASPLRLESFEQLAERGLGSAANLSVAQIEAVLACDPRFEAPPENWKANSRFRLPLQGAESLLEAGERVAAHLRQRMTALGKVSARDSLKLFVGHGAAFRHAAFVLGVLEWDDIARLSMHHAQPVYLEMLKEGVWRHVRGNWKIRATSHGYTD